MPYRKFAKSVMFLSIIFFLFSAFASLSKAQYMPISIPGYSYSIPGAYGMYSGSGGIYGGLGGSSLYGMYGGLGNMYGGLGGLYGLGGMYGGGGYGGYGSGLRTIWINGKPQLYSGPPTALEIPPGPIGVSSNFIYGLGSIYGGYGSPYSNNVYTGYPSPIYGPTYALPNMVLASSYVIPGGGGGVSFVDLNAAWQYHQHAASLGYDIPYSDSGFFGWGDPSSGGDPGWWLW